MNPLMLLAHVAWNRDTLSPHYMEGQYQRDIALFQFPKGKLRRELVSEDWSAILALMVAYKKARYPEDRRIITVCEGTAWGSLRVEWDPATDGSWQVIPGGAPRSP